MKSTNNLTYYIKANNSEILVYGIILLIITIILLIIGYITNWYYILLIDIFPINSLISRIGTKFNLKSIEEYLIKHNLINIIGEIEFWNEKNYFLTEKYIIIKIRKEISIISYDEIEYIYYDKYISLNPYNSYTNEYLYVILKDKRKYKFLIDSTLLTVEKTKDIGKYLMSKNKNIIQKNVKD